MANGTNPQAETTLPVQRKWWQIDTRQISIDVTAGSIACLLDVSVLISLAALIFAGPLSSFVASGIGLMLIGTGVMNIVYALLSSRPAMIIYAQEGPALIIALMAGSIAATLGTAVSGETMYATVVAAIMAATFASGLVFVVLGQFRLGSLVRFFPFPVIGGFLAATGWLLFLGGISVITDWTGDLAGLPDVLRANALHLIPGLLFGLLTLICLRRFRHPAVLPGLLIGANLLFYLWLAATNTPVAEAQARGWLLGPFTNQAVWMPLTPALLDQVQWPIVASQAGAIGTTVILGVFGLLLNVSGLQLARREDIDLNQELRAAGVAQVAAGFVGGTPGFTALGLSALSHRIGAKTRLVGVVTGIICVALFVFGADLLALMPRVVLGGMVFYLGLTFLTEWLYDTWFELPRGDYALIVAILVLVVVFGILPGVIAGLVIAAVLFVAAYSRIDVVRLELSGKRIKSRVTRDIDEQQALRMHGDHVLVLQLQGFLFFGTAHALYERVHTAASQSHMPALRFVVLDFRLVTRIDSTAMLSLKRMLQRCEGNGITLLFTNLTPGIARQIDRGLLHGQQRPGVRIFTDFDHGLEWCENQLLATLESARLAEHNRLAPLVPIGDALLGYFERRTILPGVYLMRQGDQTDEMFLIETGQVTAQFEPDDGPVVRLETMRGGRLVGELGFFLQRQRTAAVIADETTSVYCITREALQRLEQENPQVAATFHQLVARLLSERVVHLIDTVDALQR